MSDYQSTTTNHLDQHFGLAPNSTTDRARER